MYIKQTTGSRAQVMHGTAKQTTGGLTKSQLKYNKQGKIVSKKASTLAKKNNRLVKAGYITRKGVFGSVNMRGGEVLEMPGVGRVEVLEMPGVGRVEVEVGKGLNKDYSPVYVLWVRHCYSCANAAHGLRGIYKGTARQPLCNELGVYQSHTFGEILKRKIDDLKKKYSLNEITVSASYLPRAIETAKIISIGLGDTSKDPAIKRIPFVSEYKSSMHYEMWSTKSSQNVTTIDRSDCYSKALNKLVLGGRLVSLEHTYTDEMMDQTKEMCKGKSFIEDCVISATKSVDFPLFKENILPTLDKGKLHIIVSHGKYIEGDVLQDCEGVPVPQTSRKYRPDYFLHKRRPKKIQNLEAHLIRYDFLDKTKQGIYQDCKMIKECNQYVIDRWKNSSKNSSNNSNNSGNSGNSNNSGNSGNSNNSPNNNSNNSNNSGNSNTSNTSPKDSKTVVEKVVNKVFKDKHKEFATCDYKYHDRENRNQSIEQVGVCLGPNAHINIARKRRLM